MLLYLVLALYFFVFGNWVLSFTSLDEGRNMDAVKNMLETGNYLIPFYNCHERFEKPPLLYWLVILSSKVFGLNEFSARLVSGLSALGVSFLTYKVAKDFFNREVGLKAFLVSLLFIHYWIESRAVVPEMTLTFFMLLGLYLFLKERFVLGWVALSLAFLTKGPVGVFLPSVVYLIFKRNFKFLNPKGILIFFLLGGSWYYLMLFKYGYEYFYRFFIYENIMRFTGGRQVHPYPFWYYVPVILVSTLLFIPKYKDFPKLDRRFLPFLGWASFVVLFFSLSHNKLHHYILFAYPPLAVVFGYLVDFRYLKRVLVIGGVLLAFLVGMLFVFEKGRFVPKASPIVKAFEGNVHFYRAENSAVVYYSDRCIPFAENPNIKGLVITKEKYKGVFNNCELLVEGKEFEGRYILVHCKE
ncbi:ArnT family glycosyltransferase [Aquifex sp.]